MHPAEKKIMGVAEKIFTFDLYSWTLCGSNPTADVRRLLTRPGDSVGVENYQHKHALDNKAAPRCSEIATQL